MDIKGKEFDVNHIGVLDGIRALAIVIVVWFHLWQQSWLTPYITVENTFLKYFEIKTIPINLFIRYGFLFVDLIVLLSAFCNFLPYVRSIILGTEWPSFREFYVKRAARILPSYFLAFFLSFIIEFSLGNYNGDLGLALRDFVTHLFFISGCDTQIVLLGKINTVLWTVEMEILFYLIMPLVASLFKKFPVATYSVMMLIGIISRNIIIYKFADKSRLLVNHPLTFFLVYANGLLACYIVVYFRKNCNDCGMMLACTVASILSVFVIGYILGEYGKVDDGNIAQLDYRLILSFVFSLFVISTCLSFRQYQLLFDNKLMRLICLFSYNLYIWHQYIFSKMVIYHIPSYSGETNPAWNGDRGWALKYTGLALICAIVVAVIVTLIFEIPIKNFILKKYNDSKKLKAKI